MRRLFSIAVLLAGVLAASGTQYPPRPHTHQWKEIKNEPKSLAGYGITNSVQTANTNLAAWGAMGPAVKQDADADLTKLAKNDGGSLTNVSAVVNGSVTGDFAVAGGDITGANGTSLDIGEVLSTGMVVVTSPSASYDPVLTARDDNNNANLRVAAGGSGSLYLGGYIAASGATNTAVHIETDGTGDAELVVPAGSVSASELVTAVQTSLGKADTALQYTNVWRGLGVYLTTNDVAAVELGTAVLASSLAIDDNGIQPVAAWTNITLPSPGSGRADSTLTLYSVATNSFTIVPGSSVVPAANIVLDQMYESVTLLAKDQNQWIVIGRTDISP